MLLALLICTDGDCALHYEALGIPEELDGLVCESCGCALQAISWAEAASNGAGPAVAHVQLLGVSLS